jgi:hypothetical protein
MYSRRGRDLKFTRRARGAGGQCVLSGNEPL